MRVFDRIILKYGGLFYVQIWEQKLKVTEASSGRTLEEPPLVAIRTENDGKKVIEAVGNKAKLSAIEGLNVVNPFSHPRVLISDFTVGEKLLAHFFQIFNKEKFIAPSPTVVIHPMERTDGGLSGIERRAFRELGIGAGARKVYVYEGPEIPLHELREERFEKEEGMRSIPEKRASSVSTVVYYALFLMAVLFAFFFMKINGN